MALNNISTKRNPKVAKRRSERNILTFYEKIAVIRYYDETNISRNSLAKMFHCCATQIRRILERKDELLQQLATLSEADASIIIEEMTRKRRKFEMCAISFILHQWVERCRQLRLRKSITNQTLKDTALKMAAILNLPTFRPSYRWLNRFRGKYKYNEQDLGASETNTINGELSVEDIIIEFKDSLPSFMQKEISVITSTTKVDDNLMTQINETTTTATLTTATTTTTNTTNTANVTTNTTKTITKTKTCSIEFNDENSKDFDISGEDDDVEDDDDGTSEALLIDEKACNGKIIMNNNLNDNNTTTGTSAGTTALLNSVFPHLAVIHQFALLNSDVKALELISQLGVHMQTQAAEGAYKQMSLETTDNAAGSGSGSGPGPVPGMRDTNDSFDDNYAIDFDDIILIE